MESSPPGPTSRRRQGSGRLAGLWAFTLLNYLALVASSAGFLSRDAFHALLPAAFVTAVWLTYPFLYLLPALALGAVARLALAGVADRSRGAALRALSWAPTVILFSAVQLFIYSDRRIHEIYGFHFNGFVWNLVTTPGGIRSMGAGPEAFLAAAGLAVAILAAETALLVWCRRGHPGAGLLRWLGSPRLARALVVAGLALTLSERVAYGISGVVDYNPVLQWGQAFPFYLPLSIKGLARSLGFEVVRSKPLVASLRGSALDYPLHPLAFAADAPPENVLILCAESLRADALQPDLMPATLAFAKRGVRFEHHLSAGNGTRMGVFGLLYGLPGPYWFRALEQNRGPELIGALQRRGWEVRGYTSDDFQYPEFDQTVFADVDREDLWEGGPEGGASWERDRRLVSHLLDFLDQRDPERPFFVYAFFESPHARYQFPPETAVRKPYLETFNYVTADLERDMPLIRNRYWNSVRHLDTQLERIIAELGRRGLLASTVVLITGDHGEEFMEKGRWGHGSGFSEEEIHVPLVLVAPGVEPRVVERTTSHLDVAATILTLLGAENPPSDYSLGHDLLGEASDPYVLVSDWSQIAYVDDQGKATFPLEATTFFRQDVIDREDRPLPDPSAFLRARTARLAQVLRDLGRFTGAPPTQRAEAARESVGGT